MKIQATIFNDAEEFLRNELPDMFVDGISAVYPNGELDLENLTRSYYDEEEDRSKFCTKEDHLNALKLLAEQVGNTLFVGGITSAVELTDPCNWDVEVVDAYFQLIFHGEVIYG